MGRKITYILFLFTLSLNSWSMNADSIFFEGNKFYQENNYEQANLFYKSILDEGYLSKELYLNLGNSYFKLDSIPQAILAYEKGLKIAPANDDLTHNLKQCNRIIKDKNPIKKSILISELIYSFLGKSPNYWANTSLMLMGLLCILILFYKISPELKWQKINFYSAIVVSLLFLFSVGLAWLSKNRIEDTNYGIMFSPSTKILVEPSQNAAAAYLLHEGSKAKIIAENNEWYEISYDKKVGWIKKYHLKKI